MQWLLGAYTEYLKLLSTRAMNRSRDAYVAELVRLRLVGGGFPEFRAVESTVYDVLDPVDPDDEAQVDRAVHALNDLYRRIDWIPLPFYAVLDGKNHLPRAKIRPDTFDPSQGFLRTGAYRTHFFGEHSLLEVGGAFAARRSPTPRRACACTTGRIRRMGGCTSRGSRGPGVQGSRFQGSRVSGFQQAAKSACMTGARSSKVSTCTQ